MVTTVIRFFLWRNPCFPHRKRASSELAFNRLVLGAARRLGPHLSLGAALHGYWCPLDVKVQTGPSRIGAEYAGSTLAFGDNFFVLSLGYGAR